METTRQRRVAKVLQQDLAEVIQASLRESGVLDIIVSVSKVNVTTDLSIAKVYVSIFPQAKAEGLMADLNKHKFMIKHEIAQRTKHQLRRMPELHFYNDDSLDYIDGIDKSLKGQNDPIENPDLLPRRKKS